MPRTKTLQARRATLLDRIDAPVLLMAGGAIPRNYPGNPYPFRPDSSFLYFFAGAEPGAAALFDPADESVTLFLPERTLEDALWMGPVPGFEEMRERHGATEVRAVEKLAEHVRRRAGDRPVESLAVADPRATATARAITGQDLDFADPTRVGSPGLIQAIGTMRACKDDEEIAAMRRTAEITGEAHHAAITATRPGVVEQELSGRVTGTFARHGCVPAYDNICTVRGEVLHNHDHGNTLREGDLVLLDAGAELPGGYCSDVTRTWPAGGTFAPEAAELYDIVLAAERGAIAAVEPGVRYRNIHLLASRILAEGLAGMGVLRGNPDALVESGAHALFFPHGVGHLIGLDVHDMEAFGDAIAYPDGRTRSAQFGTANLRLDMDCAPGMTFTIEPGIYFVPAILHNDEFRTRFRDQVDWDRCERFLTANDGRGFGGIRIEDDVLVTGNGSDVLTGAIPSDRGEIEALVGSGG